MAFDEVHDEMIVPNPFAQAILFFRGAANGEEAPIRVIQGPKADIHQSDIIRTPILYPAGKKIFVAGSPVRGDKGVVLGVWNYGDNGDVAPWAIIANSATTKAKKSNGGMAIDPVAKEVM